MHLLSMQDQQFRLVVHDEATHTYSSPRISIGWNEEQLWRKKMLDERGSIKQAIRWEGLLVARRRRPGRGRQWYGVVIVEA